MSRVFHALKNKRKEDLEEKDTEMKGFLIMEYNFYKTLTVSMLVIECS